MPIGKLVFAQLMDFLPLHTFRRCVARYPSSYPTKTFSHLDQYLCMAFAQLTFRESLRDIEVCLRAQGTKLYHLGIRGHVSAYDARDGHLVWTFNTVPGPGEFGHDTWPKGSEVWKYGGGGVWQTPAVDPKLGLIYFSTANPGPVLNGYLRKGDNLFTSSILALDVHTGKYRWHFQEVHHDIWDQDAPNPVILFDAPYKGVMRKGIVQSTQTTRSFSTTPTSEIT